MLESAGWSVQPFDLSDGQNLLDEESVLRAAEGCIPTIVLRPVMIVNDDTLASLPDSELSAFVHVEDVAEATLKALTVNIEGHHRLAVCGPGDFDTSAAFETLGWRARRGRLT